MQLQTRTRQVPILAKLVVALFGNQDTSAESRAYDHFAQLSPALAFTAKRCQEAYDQTDFISDCTDDKTQVRFPPLAGIVLPLLGTMPESCEEG